MNSFFLILTILFGGAIISYFAGKLNAIAGGVTAFLSIGIATVLYYTQINTGDIISFNLGGIDLQWGINSYGQIFSLIVLSIGVLASMYSIQYMQNNETAGFYFNFVLSITAMMGIIFSQDWVSFFIFWEIMTWSSYLIVIYNGNKVKKIGITYMVFSALGAYAMLSAIVMIKGTYDTFLISQTIASGVLNPANGYYIPLMLLFGFGVKAAIMPFHVWAPDAYSNSPMSYTAVFSGALSKMGVLGMGIVFFNMIGNILTGDIVIKIIQWLAAITAVMATLYALIQTDAKKLLAYSSVAQLGYITVGLAVGTKLAVMSALFLAVIHMLFKGTLFLAVGAVERQVGTTDMTKVSGLIKKMPLTFLSTLIAIIALAGIPPLAGFVGKWMLYEALITSGNYFLVIMIFFSSTAAFLYCYRILFGLFLGQQEDEIKDVKEAPVLMIIPMLILGLSLIVLGAYPGLLFEPIAAGMQNLGFHNVTWDMTVLTNVWGQTVNLQYVNIAIVIGFVLGAGFLTLKGYKNTRAVSSKDISTSGEIPDETDNMTFQLDFFKPFERAAEPLYRRKMSKIWNELAGGLEALFNFTRKIYTGNGQTYAVFVIVFLVIMLLLKDNLFIN